MPFGRLTDDYELNPHFLYGGVVTALPDTYRWDASDCTGPQKLGGDKFVGETGIFITAPILPRGQFHRLRVNEKTDPKRAAINYTSEAQTLIGCLNPSDPRYYPERPYNQGNVGRIFIYAGVFDFGGGHLTPACFGPNIDRPIRGCPTAYGWYLEIDSGGTGNFDMQLYFLQGP